MFSLKYRNIDKRCTYERYPDMKKINNIAAVITAAVTAATLTGTFPSAAAESAVRYEFEDGSTDGGKIYSNGTDGVKLSDFPEGTDLSGFSGKGFSYIDQKGTSVSVKVEAPEAGLYELTFRNSLRLRAVS